MAEIGTINSGEPPENNDQNSGIGNENNTSNASVGSGNDNANGNGNGSGNFEFVNQSEQPAKRGRGRPRKDGNAESTTTSKKAGTKGKVKDGEKAAKFMISRMEKFSALVLHKDTAFNQDELFLIEPSLASILDDLQIDAVEKYSKIINPILLLLGLLMWYMRIAPQQTRPIRPQSVTPNDNQNSAVHETDDTNASIYSEKRDDNPFFDTIIH